MLDRIRLGVAYYPEQDPEEEWDLDAALMQEAGIDTIRISEFCWNRLQRPDGRLTLEWLERVINLFHKRGIQTILCTPTAAPPIWVVERFDDLAPLLPDGRQGLFGGRRHYSAFHAGYRQLCAELVSQLAERFGAHQAVTGWYIDNEVGTYSTIDCSPSALRDFHAWVEKKYGDVDQLNRAWNMIFWNQEIERFDQLPAPTPMMCTRNPSYLLDYNRFCLEGFADFILMQAEAIRKRIPAGSTQWIMSSCEDQITATLHRLEAERGTKWVDYGSVNNYPELLPGPGENAMRLDRHRGINAPRPFLVPELQVGTGYTTTGAICPEARRLWAFESLARGGRMLCWFHWRRFRGGCEWRHPSIIERDRKKRLIFQSLHQLIGEIRNVTPILLEAKVSADIQVLYSLDNAIAHDRASEPQFWMEIQLPEACTHRFSLWEKELRRAVYNPLSRFGLTLDFVNETQDWAPQKPLIATDLDMVSEAMVKTLHQYCNAGGTLICFPGAGERDLHGCHREAPPPGNLGDLFGVELQEYYPINERGGPIFDSATGNMTRADGELERETTAKIAVGDEEFEADVCHGEVLDVRGATVIGRFKGGPCDGKPAIASRPLGQGFAIYLGITPKDANEACRLYRALLPSLTGSFSNHRSVKLDTPSGPYQFLLNDSQQTAPLPSPVNDAITGQTLNELPAYGVALVRRGPDL